MRRKQGRKQRNTCHFITRKYAKFKWSDECQKSFDMLKNQLASIPLLGYPDPNKPYVFYTDASDKCIGSYLTQLVSDDDSPER